LELAATIGKQLLEKDQQLEVKIEFLEQQLDKTSDMVNQLRYDITLKDQLLKTFLDEEEYEQTEDEDGSWPRQRRQISGLPDASNVSSVEILNEYKRKIEHLESENDMLRNKADFFEKETVNLEAKESAVASECAREYEHSQSRLRTVQDELRCKTAVCSTQQEEIQGLFAQIFELQLRIKSVTRESADMQTANESTKLELLEQIAELKAKYNECLSLLTRTQDELAQLRRKSGGGGGGSSRRVALLLEHRNNNNQDDDEEDERDEQDEEEYDESASAYDLETSFKPAVFVNGGGRSNKYSPWTSTNSNSLAAELFSSMAKEFRFQNSNMCVFIILPLDS
jgi:hypothetical protein